MNSPKKYTTGFVLSKDGTKIAYRKMGSGEGLVLVHGGMMYSENFMSLAELLRNDFTIYIPDRCGRGLSEMHKDHSLLAESEDILAILNQTNTQNVFGLSSGAIVVLQAALLHPAVSKIALFEPPIPVAGANPSAWMDNYKRAMAKQRFGRAFISIVKGTADSSLMNFLPAFMTAPFMQMAINREAKKKTDEGVASLQSLISAMQYDITVINQSAGMIDKCKNLAADVLLLGGTKSQSFLKIALERLGAALPRVRQIKLSNAGHVAADNSGNPGIVAAELRKFFGGTVSGDE